MTFDICPRCGACRGGRPPRHCVTSATATAVEAATHPSCRHDIVRQRRRRSRLLPAAIHPPQRFLCQPAEWHGAGATAAWQLPPMSAPAATAAKCSLLRKGGCGPHETSKFRCRRRQWSSWRRRCWWRKGSSSDITGAEVRVPGCNNAAAAF